jgi:hypothetical protein
VPTFIQQPVKDFLEFHEGITDHEDWDSFSKLVEVNVYKEPSLLYLLLVESDINFRISLIVAICAFLKHSPVQKWQGPLEKDEVSDRYSGFRYDLMVAGESK